MWKFKIFQPLIFYVKSKLMKWRSKNCHLIQLDTLFNQFLHFLMAEIDVNVIVAVSGPQKYLKLISKKIWVEGNFWYFHTVSSKQLPILWCLLHTFQSLDGLSGYEKLVIWIWTTAIQDPNNFCTSLVGFILILVGKKQMN